MAKSRIIYWIDAGMAVMAGVFIAIVLALRDESYFVPVLLGYGAAVIVWASLSEYAAVTAEREETAPISDPGVQHKPHTEALPH